MALQKRQIDVLNHVIEESPQAWYDNVVAVLGQVKADDALAHKVSKYEAHYDDCVAQGNYRNRNERDADDCDKMDNEWAGDLPTAKVKRIKELKEHISKQYIAHVDDHYSKKRRKVERGQSAYIIPSSVEDYEDNLKTAGAEMKVAINAMTKIQEIRNHWPDLPEEPEI